jgi:hypothetical protein
MPASRACIAESDSTQGISRMGWTGPHAMAGEDVRRAARRRLAVCALWLGLLPVAAPARAQPDASPDEQIAQADRFFHIAAGPVDGSSFTVAGFLATALSAPAGSRPCDRGGSCGDEARDEKDSFPGPPQDDVGLARVLRRDGMLGGRRARHFAQLVHQ